MHRCIRLWTHVTITIHHASIHHVSHIHPSISPLPLGAEGRGGTGAQSHGLSTQSSLPMCHSCLFKADGSSEKFSDPTRVGKKVPTGVAPAKVWTPQAPALKSAPDSSVDMQTAAITGSFWLPRAYSTCIMALQGRYATGGGWEVLGGQEAEQRL